MCRYISAIYNPKSLEVRAAILYSHHLTYVATGLSDRVWYEMHYTPAGSIECRVPYEDCPSMSNTTTEKLVHEQWPTFAAFEAWAIAASSDYYNEGGYDRDGYDRDGYNEDGYDIDGYDIDGYDRYGHDMNGYNEDGYDEDGYDRDGYDEDGYDRDGYDEDGYDRDGYDEDGCSERGFPKIGVDGKSITWRQKP